MDQKSIVKGVPYYSRGRFAFARSGVSPAFTFTLSKGVEVRLFGYARGQDMAIAGRSLTTATEADTNLQTASQTIDGETVDIRGLKLAFTGQSDPALAVAAAADISCRISLNGGERGMLLGNLEMIPGGSGIFVPNGVLSASTAGIAGAALSGFPEVDNAAPIRGGLVWNSAGKTDSSLVVILRVERDIVVNVSNANAPAAPFIDLRAELVSGQRSKQSANL